MAYKKFQDWYHEANIKHLMLFEHDGCLMSPPFATKKCEDYGKILKYDGSVSYIDTQLPIGTSKINSVIKVGDSSWFIPYAIYDDFNTVLQLKGERILYHKLTKLGKGQFYSGASNGNEGFSFPLGYSETQYAIHIKNDRVISIPFAHAVTKAHMGTVVCDNKFYSMPRGDEPNYCDLVCFNGSDFQRYTVPVDTNVTRKFTDIIVVGKKLYSLPYGETAGLTEVIEFDTETNQFTKHILQIPDFPKKFNSMVLVNETIVGLPYGDKKDASSNYGIAFNTRTKESHTFDIELSFGGKYRYRCGVEYNNLAWFFPTGSADCPVLVIDEQGNIIYKRLFNGILMGRPLNYLNKICVLCYEILTQRQMIYVFDRNFNISEIPI